MKKVIVTLRSAPTESIDVPSVEKSGRGAKKVERKIERSCFGAIRIFPGIPKAISVAELGFIERNLPKVFARLSVSEYVESRRVDRRGVSEADLEKLSAEGGIEHLSAAKRIEVLRSRGKIPREAPKPAKPAPSQKSKGPSK